MLPVCNDYPARHCNSYAAARRIDQRKGAASLPGYCSAACKDSVAPGKARTPGGWGNAPVVISGAMPQPPLFLCPRLRSSSAADEQSNQTQTNKRKCGRFRTSCTGLHNAAGAACRATTQIGG